MASGAVSKKLLKLSLMRRLLAPKQSLQFAVARPATASRSRERMRQDIDEKSEGRAHLLAAHASSAKFTAGERTTVEAARQKTCPDSRSGHPGITISNNVNAVWTDYFIVGMTNSAPSLTPDGQRAVTVLVLV